jgi:site-specific recombinase XerC
MGKNLVQQALERIGKRWDRGKGTRLKSLGNTKEIARFLEQRYGLEKIENMKPHMVLAYIQDVQDRGLSASALQGKMTAMRELATSIGKQNIVPRENKTVGIERIRINPQNVDQNKLAEIRGALAERAAAGNRVALMMVAAGSLREAFGLRAKESLMTSKVVIIDGKEHLSVEGAKGGRPRQLPINNETKVNAVKLAQETSKALGSRTGRIIPPEMSLEQAYNAQRNTWRSLGGTRANDANMHGERHLRARQMKQEGAAKKTIMDEIGHGESRSSSAYGV